MNGKTAKVLRELTKNRKDYRALKVIYLSTPKNKRGYFKFSRQYNKVHNNLIDYQKHMINPVFKVELDQ